MVSDKTIYGRFVDGRIEPWGGACMCSFCARQKAHRTEEGREWRAYLAAKPVFRNERKGALNV